MSNGKQIGTNLALLVGEPLEEMLHQDGKTRASKDILSPPHSLLVVTFPHLSLYCYHPFPLKTWTVIYEHILPCLLQNMFCMSMELAIYFRGWFLKKKTHILKRLESGPKVRAGLSGLKQQFSLMYLKTTEFCCIGLTFSFLIIVWMAFPPSSLFCLLAPRRAVPHLLVSNALKLSLWLYPLILRFLHALQPEAAAPAPFPAGPQSSIQGCIVRNVLLVWD